MNYKTIRVRFQKQICFIQFYRPESNNCINDLMVDECFDVLEKCEESITIVVLEGLPEVFCFGADFNEMNKDRKSKEVKKQSPERLYDLWLKLATGSYITVSYVRGKVNAGGVGFVASSDIVLADDTAQFSLSELLFGLYPACVLPFLIRRIGFQKAHYLTLMTQPIDSKKAYELGIVDALDSKGDVLLSKHLMRLRYLSKIGIARYKEYMNTLNDSLTKYKYLAIESNREVFTDSNNINKICRYVEEGVFPWEQ